MTLACLVISYHSTRRCDHAIRYDHDANAVTDCLDCPRGLFANYSGAHKCEKCKQGWGTIGAGSTLCEDCTILGVSGVGSSGFCTLCTKGRQANVMYARIL